jgi:tetratricopeptide (TPR) repeat protein
MVAALLLASLLAAGDGQTGQRLTQAQAIELAGQGKHQAALEAFQQLAADNPRNLEARLWIGRMHGEMGHHDLAESVFRSAMLENPDNIDAIIGLSDALVGLRRTDEALVVLSKAASAQPQNPELSAAVRRARSNRFPWFR